MMPARAPEDWPRLFAERLDAGDLPGAVALYEPDARVVSRAGEVIVGHHGIRGMLAGMIASTTRMQCRVTRVVAIDAIALVYNDWSATAVDESGRATAMRGKAIEIVRRQPDATWRLIVGDPYGRG
jgi:ketosteroid isomerase-like protein